LLGRGLLVTQGIPHAVLRQRLLDQPRHLAL
jgi:hypothetical protein